MPAGQLDRMFAYQVFPQQDADIAGGRVSEHSSLQDTLDSAFDQSKLTDGPAVGFNVDPSTREHPVREDIMRIAFDADEAAQAASEKLAARLAGSMDNRSKPALLGISTHLVEGRSSDRTVVLWTFPQQEVFRLSVSSDETAVRLMDAFNRESNLRKAAYFQGGNSRVDFLSGRILDSQSTAGAKIAADFWVGKFLDASLQMGTREGSRFLAKALRTTHEKYTGIPEAQAQVHVAVLGIKNSEVHAISFEEVADRYLSGVVAQTFLEQARRDEIRTARFELDRDVFDQQVQYQLYYLRNGVLVSVPFQGDASVSIRDVDGERHLEVSGIIEDEKLRARRGQ